MRTEGLANKEISHDTYCKDSNNIRREKKTKNHYIRGFGRGRVWMCSAVLSCVGLNIWNHIRDTTVNCF